MFITLEDETDIANLIVWPRVFEKYRRAVLSVQMLVCRGQVQEADGVVHLIASELIDRTDLLNSVGSEEAFPESAGRGDEARTGGGGIDSRVPKLPPVVQPREIYVPDLHIDSINVRARNLR